MKLLLGSSLQLNQGIESENKNFRFVLSSNGALHIVCCELVGYNLKHKVNVQGHI